MKLKYWLIILALAIALFLRLLPEPPQTNSSDNSFVVGPVQLFDGERLRNEHYVVVKDGFIVALTQSTEEAKQHGDNLTLIDGNNDWLLPGLIDAHVHTWGDALEQQFAHGVTTVIDTFSHPAELQNRQRPEPRADIVGAGYLVTAPEGHGTQYGIQVPVMQSPDDAERIVSERIHSGSDFIKVVYTHADASYPHAPSISYASLRALVTASREQGVLIVAHIADYKSAVDAVAAGADGLVHGFFDRVISDELLAQLIERDIFVIPTMLVYEGMLRPQLNAKHLLNRDDIHLPAAVRANLESSQAGFFPAHFYDNMLTNTRRMHEAGVRLLVGTDAPNPNTAHGFSLALEMLLFQQAGVATETILAGATSIPAAAFGLNDRGRVEVGYRADFVRVKHSPLEDLTNLLTPVAVSKWGYWY